jgi:hypothetical protein
MQTDRYNLWSYLAQFFLEWEMFQTKVTEKVEKHILWSVTFLSRKSSVEKYCAVEQATYDSQYGACALHTGYLRLQTQTYNMQYLLLFPRKIGCGNAFHCYDMRRWL